MSDTFQPGQTLDAAQLNNAFDGKIDIEGDTSLTTAIASRSVTARTLQSRFGDVVNVADFGAVGDCVTSAATPLTMPASVNPTLSVGGGVTLASADVGKSIVVPYAGPGAIGFLSQITARINATTVQLSGSPSVALSGIAFRATQVLAATGGTHYAPGDAVTLVSTGGVQSVVLTVLATKVVSATVVSGGTNGIPGSVTIAGTSVSGVPFQATGTINGSGVLTPARLALLQNVDALLTAVYGDPAWLHRRSGGSVFGLGTPAQMMAAEGDQGIELVISHLRRLESGHQLAAARPRGH